MEFTTDELRNFTDFCEVREDVGENVSITIGLKIYKDHTDIDARMHTVSNGSDVYNLKSWTVPTGDVREVSAILKTALAIVGYRPLGRVIGKKSNDLTKYSFNIVRMEGGV